MSTNQEITGGQYLSFILRDEHFAVEITKVREVLDVTTLTRIPRMPDYLCGVINLRGSVVPVVDLGLKLGMSPFERTVNTCIMIVEIKAGKESELVNMGVLTDAVQEVIDLSAEHIEPVPPMGAGLNTDFIKGMGRYQEKFLILLDLNQVRSSEGSKALKQFGDGEEEPEGADNNQAEPAEQEAA